MFISYPFSAETKATQAEQHWWIGQAFCQRAKVFPHIRGENKHTEVRKQTRSTETPNTETNLYSGLPCLHEKYLLHKHTLPQSPLSYATDSITSDLAAASGASLPHAAALLRGLLLTVMWPWWWCHIRHTHTHNRDVLNHKTHTKINNPKCEISHWVVLNYSHHDACACHSKGTDSGDKR